MKIYLKKLIAVLAAVIILFSVSPSINTQAAGLRIKTKTYGYFNPRAKKNVATIEVSGLTKAQKITKGSVKSSNPAVGKIMGYTRRAYNSSTAKVDSKSKKSSTYSYTYTIRVKVLGVGNTNITYDIDGQTYTTVLYIDEFKSPLQSITLTGVNSGSDFSSKIDFSKGNTVMNFDSADVKKAKLKVTPNTGWRVVRMSCENESTGYEYSKVSYSKSKKLKSLSMGNLKAKYDYYITVTLVDDYNNSAKVTIQLQTPSGNKL